MRVLEARFYPGSKSAQVSVVVGRLLCDGARAIIEPTPFSAAAVAPFDPVSVLDKLEYMIGSVVGDPFAALIAHRSGFWAFVEAAERGDHPIAG